MAAGITLPAPGAVVPAVGRNDTTPTEGCR